MSFSTNLYDMMTLRRMTVAELADKSGLSRNSIYQTLREETVERMTINKLRKLSMALGCTPAWLLKK